MAGRFIKLYDKILSWEWYSDINTFRLFIHLLLKANYKPLRFEGQEILRGQLVTSLTRLASQTGLSVRQIRVSLDHLKMTGEVTVSSYPRYSVITISKYDDYQNDGRLNDRQMTRKVTGKRHTDDTLYDTLNDRQMTTSIDNIENIERVEKIEQIEGSRTASRFTPPSKDQIIFFCNEQGITVDVDRFLNYYTSNGWRVGKNPMKDWKATVRNWARKRDDPPASAPPVRTVVAQQYEQRDYSQVTDDLMDEQARMIEDALRRGII